jgi:hypothetical protein
MDMGTCLTAEAEELKPNYILYQPIILDLLVSYISVGLIHIQTSLITGLRIELNRQKAHIFADIC